MILMSCSVTAFAAAPKDDKDMAPVKAEKTDKADKADKVAADKTPEAPSDYTDIEDIALADAGVEREDTVYVHSYAVQHVKGAASVVRVEFSVEGEHYSYLIEIDTSDILSVR